MQQPLQFELAASTAGYPPVLMPPWANGDGSAVDFHCTMQPMYMGAAEDQRYMMVVPPAYQVPTPRPPPATSSNSSSHWSSKVRIPFSPSSLCLIPGMATPTFFCTLVTSGWHKIRFFSHSPPQGGNRVHRLLHFRMRAGYRFATAHVCKDHCFVQLPLITLVPFLSHESALLNGARGPKRARRSLTNKGHSGFSTYFSVLLHNCCNSNVFLTGGVLLLS
jgi:hypothetical protein